jgi:hypothetical protein
MVTGVAKQIADGRNSVQQQMRVIRYQPFQEVLRGVLDLSCKPLSIKGDISDGIYSVL